MILSMERQRSNFVLHLLVVSLFLIWQSTLWAQENEGEEVLGEAAAKAARTKIPEELDWTKQITKLNSRLEKIRQLNQEISAKIREKNEARTNEQKQVAINDILYLYETLKIITKEYNELRPKIEYRFPAKGNYKLRKYLPLRMQSVEQLEERVGLDAEMTRLRLQIQKQYAPFMTKEEKLERSAAGKFTEEETEPTIKRRIRLEY